MKTRRRLELLAIISDVHAGSTQALMPPRFKLSEEQTVEASPLQLFFHECWTHATRWLGDVVNGDPFGLVLNGDMIEGDHHRSDQIISKRLGDHIDCAKELLKPIADKA